MELLSQTPETDNHVFALLIFMPAKFYLMLCLKSSIFYQNKPKIKLVLQEENFYSAGASAPRPAMASGGAPGPLNTALLPPADF